MATHLADAEGVLIYPEGTRFSADRRLRILERLAAQLTPKELQRMQSWTHLLPPRLGGPLAMLDSNAGKDLVFCAHTGFEGSSHLKDLVSGNWTGTGIRVHFWRVAFADIPGTLAQRREFLFAQWDRMQETVDTLMREGTRDG